MSLPQGFVLDGPALPQGFVLDGEPQSVADKARANLARMNANPIEETSVLQEFAQTPTGGVLTGAIKGAGSTIYNIGKLAHENIPGMSAIAPDTAGAFAEGSPVAQSLEAEGGWQQLGKGTEQLAEFFIPGAGQAGKLAPAANLAKKAGLLGRMGTEALGAAGVTAAQGGDPAMAAAGAAVATPVAAAVGNLAPRAVNSLLHPPKKAFLTGANPGRGVVNEGIVAGSLGNLYKKLEKTSDKVGAQIGQVLSLSQKGRTPSIDAAAIIDGPINDATQALLAVGNTGSAQRLAALKQGLYDTFTQMGASPNAVTPAQAFTVKKMIDRAVKMTPTEGAEASVKEVTKTVRRGFARAIEERVPEVAPLNRRFADLAEAESAVWDKLAQKQGEKLFSPSNILAGAGAGLAYWASHPSVAGAVLGTRAALSFAPTATGAAQVARAVGSVAGQGASAKGVAAAVSALTKEESNPGDPFGYGAALSGLAQTTQGDSSRPTLAGQRPVYVTPDGEELRVPAGIDAAFADQFSRSGSIEGTALDQWLKAMRKQGKIKSGGQLMFVDK